MGEATWEVRGPTEENQDTHADSQQWQARSLGLPNLPAPADPTGMRIAASTHTCPNSWPT